MEGVRMVLFKFVNIDRPYWALDMDEKASLTVKMVLAAGNKNRWPLPWWWGFHYVCSEILSLVRVLYGPFNSQWQVTLQCSAFPIQTLRDFDRSIIRIWNSLKPLLFHKHGAIFICMNAQSKQQWVCDLRHIELFERRRRSTSILTVSSQH